MPARFDRTVERLGYRVRHDEDDGTFAVLLPLWCSVRVWTDERGLHVDPRFGALRRATATWLPIISLLLAAPGLLRLSDRTLVSLGMLWCVAFIWDVYRYVLTEAAATTIRTAYLQRKAEIEVTRAVRAAG